MMIRQDRSERTRLRLVAGALELFTAQGYEATSVAQIAAAAGVTEMTFFRHFPSKESVVLDDPFDPVIAAAIVDQPPGLPPLVRAVLGLRTSWHDLSPGIDDEVRRRIRIVAATPTLKSSMFAYTATTQRVIAEALGGDELSGRVVAAAVMAALTTALLEWSVTEDTDLDLMVDTALDALVSAHG